MTQAFNLALLANAVNTSGQLNVGTNATGTLPVANGGTGLTSPGTNGNVLTSNGTSWVSQALPSGGVTSLNGQTGAITNTTFDAIGSYAFLANANNGTGYIAGSTVAGSTLYRANTIVGYQGPNIVSNGNTNGFPPYTVWSFGGGAARAASGNTGFLTPAGASTVSGTWRAMGTPGRAQSTFDSCGNRTDVNYPGSVWVRIS